MKKYSLGTLLTIMAISAFVGFYLGTIAVSLSNCNDNCNISEEKILGDQSSDNLSCVIEDCNAFNEYNEQNNIPTRCMV